MKSFSLHSRKLEQLQSQQKSHDVSQAAVDRNAPSSSKVINLSDRKGLDDAGTKQVQLCEDPSPTSVLASGKPKRILTQDGFDSQGLKDKQQSPFSMFRTFMISPTRRAQSGKRETRYSDDVGNPSTLRLKPGKRNAAASSGGKSFSRRRKQKSLKHKTSQHDPVPSECQQSVIKTESIVEDAASSQGGNLRLFPITISRFRKRNAKEDGVQTNGTSFFRRHKLEKQHSCPQTTLKSGAREKSPSSPSRGENKITSVELNEDSPETSNVLCNSFIEDGRARDKPSRQDKGVGDDNEHRKGSQDERSDVASNPSISGIWARLTGEAFRAQLNAGESLEKASQKLSEPSVTTQEAYRSHRSKDYCRYATSQTETTLGNHAGSSDMREHVAQSQARDHGRAKKKNCDESDIESPWGVKCESGESQEVEQRARSIRLSLKPFAVRTNPKTTGANIEDSDSDTVSLSDSNEDHENGVDIDELRGGEVHAHIEMFRDAFVDYTLKSLRSKDHRSFVDRIKKARWNKENVNE